MERVRLFCLLEILIGLLRGTDLLRNIRHVGDRREQRILGIQISKVE